MRGGTKDTMLEEDQKEDEEASEETEYYWVERVKLV